MKGLLTVYNYLEENSETTSNWQSINVSSKIIAESRQYANFICATWSFRKQDDNTHVVAGKLANRNV